MKRILILSFVAFAALVSCKKEVASVPSASDEVEIVFESGFSAETRATVVDNQNMPATLYVTATTGASNAAVENFTNAPFTQSSGVWKGGKYWPSAENQVAYHFAACNYQLNSDGYTISPTSAANDIVVDYLATTNFRANNSFQLEHIFARIGTVKILAPEGCTVTGMVVTMQPKVGGTYNLRQDTWTSTGSAQAATSILPKAGSSPSTASITTAGGSIVSANNDLWLVPGNYDLAITYTIHKGDFSKEYTKYCRNLAIVGGKVNNIGPVIQGGNEIPNIPDPEDASEITFSVTVADWDSIDVPANFS